MGVDCKKSVSHKVLLPASPSSERMAITKGILFHDLRHPPLWDTYLELEETGGLWKGEGEEGVEAGRSISRLNHSRHPLSIVSG